MVFALRSFFSSRKAFLPRFEADHSNVLPWTLHRLSIMLIQIILWCLLPFAVSARAHAISTVSEQPTWVDIPVSSVSSDLPNHALPTQDPNTRDLPAATGWLCGFGWCGDRIKFFNFPKRSLVARDVNAVNLQTTTSSSPCGSDPCASSTTSSASCASSDPCAKVSLTTETEVQLATITEHTTEHQTAWITDHITTTEHTVRTFTKNVNIATSVTVTSTVPGCSTFTTIVTSWHTTSTTVVHTATPSNSGCGSSGCTVTTTVATDVDVFSSTTAADSAKISGHDVVQVMTEQEMKKLMAAEKRKKELAEKKKQQDIADKGLNRHDARLVARQSMGSDGECFAVNAVTAPSFDTTLMTITRRAALETGAVDAKAITQASSHSEKKANSEEQKAGMSDFAVTTARSTLACITIRSQGAYSTICPDNSCWNGDC
jgi:hypothetical protein